MPDLKKTYTDSNSEKSVTYDLNEQILSLNQFNTLKDSVMADIENGITIFRFNLERINSINSAGLGIIISCLKSIKDGKGELTLDNINDKILNILKLTKLDKVFEVRL